MNNDLISRSALLELYADTEQINFAVYNVPVPVVRQNILDMPTIEAEPVRHGYWENANGRPKTYIRKCSVCGKEAYFCGRGCSYKFCPNCGSKMEDESDE